jgi:hypothetical protein
MTLALIVALSKMTFSISIECHHAERRYAFLHFLIIILNVVRLFIVMLRVVILWVVTLNVIICNVAFCYCYAVYHLLHVIMLTVVMPSVVILNVVAPFRSLKLSVSDPFSNFYLIGKTSITLRKIKTLRIHNLYVVFSVK